MKLEEDYRAETPWEWQDGVFLLCVGLAFAWLVSVASCEPVEAQDKPFSVTSSVLTDRVPEGTDAGQRNDKPLSPATLLLARACFAEASYSYADCAAIHGVVTRRAERAGVTYSAMLHAYTSVDRVKRIPVGAAWERLQEHAAHVFAGDVVDPCPHAMNWGGMGLATDHARAMRAIAEKRWRVAKCSTRTVNTFFSERRAR